MPGRFRVLETLQCFIQIARRVCLYTTMKDAASLQAHDQNFVCTRETESIGIL